MADEDFDYTTAQDKIARQRRLADVLRKYALDSQNSDSTDLGRMVSGHYVPPSFVQGLNANVVQPMMADRRATAAEGQSNQMMGDYNQQVQGAQQRWQQGLPQSVPYRPELPGPQAEGGSPELAERQAQIPDRASVLQATLRGMQIPGNEKEAELYNRGMQEEQVREDKQAEARAVLKATMAQRAAEKAQADQIARDKLEDKAFDDQYRREETKRHNAAMEELRRQADATTRAIAAAANANRMSIAELKAAADKADAKADATEMRDIYRNLGQIGTKMKPLVPVVGAAKEIQKMIDSYTDENGKVKDIPGVGRAGLLPAGVLSAGASVGLLDPSTNPNRAKIADLVGAIMRNQAGLSQTIAEAARVMEKTLTSGSYSQPEFLDNWSNLVRAINEDVDLVQQTHRPEAVEMFKKNGGSFENITPGQQAAKMKRLEELRAQQKAAGG